MAYQGPTARVVGGLKEQGPREGFGPGPINRFGGACESEGIFTGGEYIEGDCNDDLPLPCVVISDPGEDLDDEMAMIMLRYMAGKKYLDCKGVVANLKPSTSRARLMRGTLDTLGLWGVPVGIGTDGGASLHKETFCETARSYMPDEFSQRARGLCSGRGLLHRIFSDAAPNSIRLICISSLKDAALFLRDNTALFVEKINTVTIMGGVHNFDDLDRTGFLQPDTAQNNVYDEIASEFFYRRCQELRVPLVVLCRHAAYACPVSKKIYDTMKRTNSPIGKRLHLAQQTSIENLWKRASAPEDSPLRMGLPARCDREWFESTFCARKKVEGSECWPFVTTFNMYDPMAIIATVPALRERFFISRSKTVQGVEHHVIGISKEENGVREAPPLHHFMLNAFFQGITADLVPCEECIIITDPGQDQDDEMALIMLRNLAELRLMNCIGVICNLAPSEARARLARGTLDVLGLSDVPVGIGSDGGSTTHKDTFSISAGSYIPPVVSEDSKQMKTSSSFYTDGQMLLRKLYESAPASSNIVLICISSLRDAAQFLRENESLFLAKTKSVTIQGGCLPFESANPIFLEPDTAQNNVFDREASAYFYRRCQELGVKLNILSRHAAYRCPMPRSIYDKIASTSSPIGVRLRDCQQQAIEDLWKRTCLPAGHEMRLGLPSRCDRNWFCSTFCGGAGKERDGSSSIWDLVRSFNMYDPMALMVSSPQLRLRFFEAKEKEVNGVIHEVFGVSKEEHGLVENRVSELIEFMYHSFVKGTTINMSTFELPKWAVRKTADGKYYGGETKNGALETGSARSSSAQSLPGALDLSDRPANLGRQEHLAHSLEKSAKTPVFEEEEDSEMDYHFFEFDDILRHLLEEALISPE